MLFKFLIIVTEISCESILTVIDTCAIFFIIFDEITQGAIELLHPDVKFVINCMLKSINKGVRGGGCFTSHRRLWEGAQHSFSEGNCYAVGHGADACGDGCKR